MSKRINWDKAQYRYVNKELLPKEAGIVRPYEPYSEVGQIVDEYYSLVDRRLDPRKLAEARLWLAEVKKRKKGKK